MENNITAEDRAAVIEFLQGDPILTQSAHVRAFEREWSQWLGVRHSVFVNSGASANFITMAALRHLRGPGEVIVPTLTWVPTSPPSSPPGTPPSSWTSIPAPWPWTRARSLAALTGTPAPCS
jgi:dTDP-4-amino-4,6-dideoxygalactose transaminase